MIGEKNKSKSIWIFAAIMISIFVFHKYSNDGQLYVSDPQWDCIWVKDECKCDIAFEIRSSSAEDIHFKLSIRAQEKRAALKGGSIEIIDQNIVNAKILGKGIYRFKDSYVYNRRPDKIIVTILK